ncbi:N-acetylmuramoyl-L-alanine amidase [Aridibaculum aurantiacum]|uniref:N-acetylmuramoyl-L-alanine amidase n=1 Tax=Aridibaculum aurantiacum TaxID=2810307 RepID=UPI001A969A99|nr:N-acetylmuramoyl-L-alanine amidase [Aridibaculum aurantiacum]
MPNRGTVILVSIVAVVSSMYSCTRHPYYATNKQYKQQAKELAQQIRQEPALISGQQPAPAYWVGTTNFNLRKPNIVVLHHTAQNSCEQTLKTFTLTSTQVSAHYVICRDGTIHQMLNDYLRAWHGGVGKWGSVTDINSSSIGIELDNNGTEPFPEVQINSLLVLLDTLKRRHNIPAANFIGHADIAPTRKVDPSILFPWQTLAKRGFGLWYDETKDTIPANFDHLLALKVIGYDLKDSTAAIMAFKRKYFAMERTPPTFSEQEKRLLYSVMRKAL